MSSQQEEFIVIKFEPFLQYYQDVKGVSADTITAYRSDLKKFAAFLDDQGIRRIDQIDHAVITGYITYMRESAHGRGGRVGLSDSTIARRLAAVSSFFDYSRANSSHKLRNPIDDFSNRWKRNNRPKPVERDIIDKLLSATGSPRDRVLLILFLATGLRLSEMAQLDRSTIVIERHSGNGPGEFVVLGTGEVVGKGNKRRTFYVSAKALLPYVRYMKDRKDGHPALFLSERKQRMSTRAMQERLAYWCCMAGVPHINIHRLRHTFATWLANADMDILQLKELLGHASIATTLQYTKIADTTLARGYHAAMEFVNG
jgi:site-specific recombinase XerD